MIRKLAPDKWKHFFVGIAMGLVLQALAWYFLPLYPLIGLIVVFSVIIGISYGFELFSLITRKGHHEILDAVASILGGIIGQSAIFLFQIS